MHPTQLAKYFLRFVLSNRRKKYGTHIHGEEIFSANFQDLAVINLFKRKKAGTYIEIGAQDPVKRSNTYALEVNYAWNGLSFELEPEYVYFFNRFRQNKCIEGDATKHHYAQLFKQHGLPKVIDYLQIDIDPPSASLKVLERIPFDEFRFSFIAFEHDTYQFGSQAAKAQRQILQSHGYVLLAMDASLDNKPFEDWWISKEYLAQLNLPTPLALANRDCEELALLLGEL